MEYRLTRCTDTLWTYGPKNAEEPRNDITEVQLELPADISSEARYTLVRIIASTFEKLSFTFQQIGKERIFSTTPSERWKLVAVETDRMGCKSLLCRPCHRNISSQKILHMKLIRDKQSSCCLCCSRVYRQKFARTKEIFAPQPSILPKFSELCPADISFAQLMMRNLFDDPFTRLATRAFQSTEANYVMERDHRGSLQYSLKGNVLKLKKVVVPQQQKVEEQTPGCSPTSSTSNSPDGSPASSPLALRSTSIRQRIPSLELSRIPSSLEISSSSNPDSRLQETNRRVTRIFIAHLSQEYGEWLHRFLKHTYELDLEKILAEGTPLYPDHVFKANIGANNIEMTHIKILMDTLKELIRNIRANPQELENNFSDYFHRRGEIGRDGHLAMREFRNLIQQTLKFFHRKDPLSILVKEALQYLEHILPPEIEHPEDLQPDQFQNLIHLLVSTEEELERAFTGRKITHTAISGFPTIGNANIANPCRDMLELLHIFQQMRQCSAMAYMELLVHVVARKTLYRRNIDGTDWHVGLLIPGPNLDHDHETWFCNDSFIDDKQGNFSYTLKPAVKGYQKLEVGEHTPKPLPYIKLYRSTVNDQASEGSYDSFAADCNADCPGSLNPDLALKRELPNFALRTIPLWMGYVLLGYLYKETSHPSYDLWMGSAVSLFEEYKTMYQDRGYIKSKLITDEDISTLNQLLREKRYPALLDALLGKATLLREDPRQKISQDIAFGGHSLGGALAQGSGVYQFLTRMKRCPLPGCTITCYTSHAPGISNTMNTEFMRLGEEHSEMLNLNGIKYDIYHQFERGDFVPQSGGSHLGTPINRPPEEASFTSELSIPSQKAWLAFHAHVFTPLVSARSKEIVDVSPHMRRIGNAMPDRDYTMTKLDDREIGTFDHSWFLTGKLQKAFAYRIFKSPRLTECFRKYGGPFFRKTCLCCCKKRQVRRAGTRDTKGVWYLNFTEEAALRQFRPPGTATEPK